MNKKVVLVIGVIIVLVIVVFGSILFFVNLGLNKANGENRDTQRRDSIKNISLLVESNYSSTGTYYSDVSIDDKGITFDSMDRYLFPNQKFLQNSAKESSKNSTAYCYKKIDEKNFMLGVMIENKEFFNLGNVDCDSTGVISK